MQCPIATITVGERYRREMGDLHPLAASMHNVGLLHPVVLTPDYRLVAGARRLAAAQHLGWTHIEARIIDLPSLLQAEQDENTLREPFLPSEAVAIGRALEEEIAARNAQKQQDDGRHAGNQGGRGKKKTLTTNNSKGLSHDRNARSTAAQVSKSVGMGGTTYTKAKAVVEAAEQQPDAYSDLVTQMDTTRSVDKAYQTLQRRKSVEGLDGPSPHQHSHDDPARRWTQSFHDLYKLMNSVRHFADNDLRTLTATWSQTYRTQSAAELRRIRAIMDEWITALEEHSHE